MILLLLALQTAAAAPLDAIGPQSLPDRGCAAFLWNAADQRLVAMATTDPAQLRVSLDGKVRDLARVALVGSGATGLDGVAEYRADDVTATLETSVEARQSLVQGALVREGVLRIDRRGHDGVAVPVAGLIGCKE